MLAVAALGLWLLLPGGALRAQDAAIEYAENGTGPVATYTATDPEGRTVYWSLADDADAVTAADIEDADHFVISSDGVLSFKFSPDYEVQMGGGSANDSNTYKVVVTASDNAPGAGTVENPTKVAYEKVTVMVTDVDEPGIVTLLSVQPQVSIGLTAMLTDDDATTTQIGAAKWKWEHASTANGPWTPILTAKTSVYMPIGVEDKYLRVTATYTDGHGSGKTAQAVSAANNAAPVFPTGSGARSVDENSPPGASVGKPVVANDAPGDVLTYTLGDTDADEAFDIYQATGQITVGARTTLDTETDAEATVEVTATDPADGDAMQEVTITVKNVNEAPMISEGFTRNSQPEYDDGTEAGDVATAITAAKVVVAYEATDPEITGAGTCVMASCTWSVSGTDAGDFEISNVAATFGALTFKEAPNYEMQADANRDNVYMVTVVVTDSKKATAMRDVTITITNVDEDGTVTLSSEQPKIGIALTATLEDVDGVVADSVKWTWHSNNIGDGEVIAMATSDTYTPKVIGMLSVKASYTDEHGSGKSAVGTTEADVILNTANVAPKFPVTETGMREVAENTMAGVAVNDAAGATDPAPVEATDANSDTLTYTLSGTDAASFGIARGSGQLQAKAKLDYETKNSYMVTVTATDSDGLSASIDVTIKVTDMYEAPKIIVGGLAISGPASASYAENGTDLVATYTLAGPESDSGSWTLGGADAGDFRISNSGVVTFSEGARL